MNKHTGKTESNQTVRKAGSAPLYQQLAKDLGEQIYGGQYSPHEKFPTEKELCKTYNLSAPTVRQALYTLVHRGLLVRQRGRGTFVRPISQHSQASDKKVIKHHRIGLVMPWGEGTFFAPLLGAIEEIVSASGFQTILVNNIDDPDLEQAKVRELIDHGVDAIVWMCPTPGSNEAFALQVLESVPVVVALDRAMNLGGRRLNLVEADNRGGMEQIVNHLVATGRKRLALVREPQRVSSVFEREQGFFDGMKRAGLDCTDAVFTSRQRFMDNGELCAEKILRSGRRFDAICCEVDATAVGVIHRLHDRGVGIPDEIAVTGFNDDDVCTAVKPQLTSIAVDVGLMGRRAAELVLEQLRQLEGQEPTAVTCVTLPVSLVVRQSTQLGEHSLDQAKVASKVAVSTT